MTVPVRKFQSQPIEIFFACINIGVPYTYYMSPIFYALL